MSKDSVNIQPLTAKGRQEYLMRKKEKLAQPLKGVIEHKGARNFLALKRLGQSRPTK